MEEQLDRLFGGEGQGKGPRNEIDDLMNMIGSGDPVQGDGAIIMDDEAIVIGEEEGMIVIGDDQLE